MIEFLNSLEWPAVFALVGSLVTIVTGLLGYLVAIRKGVVSKPTVVNTPPVIKTLTVDEYEKIHTRINDAVDRIAINEGDLKEARASLKSLQKQIADHEKRDIQDFQLIDTKLERLMDIVVRILQDDKL